MSISAEIEQHHAGLMVAVACEEDRLQALSGGLGNLSGVVGGSCQRHHHSIAVLWLVELEAVGVDEHHQLTGHTPLTPQLL